MTQAATLAQLQERYFKASEAKEAAFLRAQSAFVAWDNAVNEYNAARIEQRKAGAALMDAEISAA